MNSLRLSAAPISRLLLFVFLFIGLLAAPARADLPPAALDQALAVARGWLAEIDSGKYEQSYAQGCTAFHHKVSEDEWITVLKSVRPVLGTVVSRKEASHAYKPDGYEGLDGECLVIIYNTVFSKVDSVIEVVVLKNEDGQWRGAGYNAQPQQAAAPDADAPPPQTSGSSQ